ncbi:MAG: hypothetical protein JZD41_02555 [Thermoproteus sp.]|nr:hypothetical protein [Thermoproteus sp.]
MSDVIKELINNSNEIPTFGEMLKMISHIKKIKVKVESDVIIITIVTDIEIDEKIIAEALSNMVIGTEKKKNEDGTYEYIMKLKMMKIELDDATIKQVESLSKYLNIEIE